MSPRKSARPASRVAAARARKIKLVLFDVDGVLTDGTIFLFPAHAGAGVAPEAAESQLELEKLAKADAGGYCIASRSVIEAKGFHAHDGVAITLARLAGLKTGLITKRISETVALRARDLRLDYVRQGVADKLTALHEILADAGLGYEHAAYVGDDLIDLPVMRRCGLAIAVPNAREEAKRVAHYVTLHGGGQGAARDAVEYILRAQGVLAQVVEQYVSGERTPISANQTSRAGRSRQQPLRRRS